MKRSITVIVLCLCLALASVATIAQDATKTNKQTSASQKKTVDGDSTDKDQNAGVKKEVKSEESPDEANLTQAQQRGLFLLKQAGDEAGTITDGRNAARLQANAADQLWDHDRDYSRKLFETAFDSAVKYYRDNKPQPGAQPTQQTGIRLPQLPNRLGGNNDARMDVIRLAAKRDAILGRKFTEEYLDEKKREREENALQNNAAANTPLNNPGMMGNVDPTATDLLSTASAIYQTDPKQAMELAQRAFALGVPASAATFLSQMGAKDQPATDQLYQFAVTQLGNSPNATPGQVLLLAAYPFGGNQVWLVDGNNNSMSMAFPPPKGYKVNTALINQFLVTAVKVISRAGEMDPSQSSDVASFVGSVLFAAKTLQPKMAQFQPGLAPDLANLTAKLTQLSSVNSQQQIDKAAENVAAAGAPKDPNDTSGPTIGNPGIPGIGTLLKMPGDNEDNVKKLMEQAENTADTGARDDIYQQAALILQRLGDIDRSMDIAGKISDADYKASVKSWISYEAAAKAITDKRFDDARRLANDVVQVDQRAHLFVEIARAAIQDKDQARATELLNDATAKIANVADSQEKMRSLLEISSIFSGFDAIRGFEVLDQAIRVVNKLPNYNPYDQNSNALVRTLGGSNPNGRSNRTMTMTMGNGSFEISNTLGTLARSDFDRALLLAQSIENKPLRISSQISVASAAFDKKKVSQ